MPRASILNSIRFAELPSWFEHNPEKGITVLNASVRSRIKESVSDVHEVFTHTNCIMTRQIFAHCTVKTAVRLSQTSRFFYHLFNDIFPRLDIKLSDEQILSELGIFAHQLEKDQCFNFRALGINIETTDFPALKSILKHTQLLKKIQIPVQNEENTKKLMKLLPTNVLLKEIFLEIKPSSKYTKQIDEELDFLIRKENINILVERRRPDTTRNRIHSFTKKCSYMMFCIVFWASIALSTFLNIKYDYSFVYLFLFEVGLTCLTLSSALLFVCLTDRYQTNRNFQPNYGAINV